MEFRNKYTPKLLYQISANGNASPTFKHAGGRLLVSRVDDTNVSTGTTRLQMRVTSSGSFVNITSEGVNAEMATSESFEITLPECEIQVATTSFTRVGSTAAINFALQTI